MKKIIFVIFSLLMASNAFSQNQHDERHDMTLNNSTTDEIDEMIISGNINKKRTETALPIHILSGEKLRNNASSTLGDTIEQQLGVHSSSFGNGVGQPVIRGLTGNRVTILQNDLQSLDAASSSADHANSVESLLSEQIEIIRGPASLIYGNNAIGGVVNIIDNRIPEKIYPTIKSAVELRHSTASDENVGIIKLDGSLLNNNSDKRETGLSWHIDGLLRENNNHRIPNYALDTEAIEALEHFEGNEEVEEEHEEEHLDNNAKGYIANSHAKADQFSVGGSWIAQPKLIDEKDWAGIERLAREAVELAS